MRYLLLTLLLIGCGTQVESNCHSLEFDSYAGYAGDHVYRFIDGQSIIYLRGEEYYPLDTGSTYLVCIDGVWIESID